MDKKTEQPGYQPGFYGKKRQTPDEWVDAYFKKWAQDEARRQKDLENSRVFPSICFSRKIGVGALEIADLLSQILSFRVVDRELIERMARDASLSMKLIELFDQRYPGRLKELFAMLSREKIFIKDDYTTQLAKTVTTLASTEPTIFVGRGTHFILPRNLTLSVRITCSREYRINRVAAILNIETPEAQQHLDRCDREQKEFFKTVYQQEENDRDGFDLVINRDHIPGAIQAARIVACAFEQKFGPWK